MVDTGGAHTQTMLPALRGVPVYVVALGEHVTPALLAGGLDACAARADVGAVVIASSWPARPPGAEAVEAALGRQVAPVLVAAGNRGAIEWPATLRTVTPVGAVDDDGARCSFSAPGLAITARGCGADEPAWGTSVAVARAAASLLSR